MVVELNIRKNEDIALIQAHSIQFAKFLISTLELNDCQIEAIYIRGKKYNSIEEAENYFS